MIGYVHIELRMAGAVGGPGTDYRDRYSPRVRRRVKGKQVKVLCDLVTVSPEHMTRLRAVTDESREGGYVRRGRFLPENVFSVSLLSNPAGLVKISKTGGNET